VITGLGSGGAERMLSRLVQVGDTSSSGFRHHVVSLTDAGFFASEIERAGVPVTTLGMRGVASLPVAIWQLRRLIRRLRPDIVQTWLYHADLVGLLAAKLAGSVPVAWNLRCSDMELGRGTTGWLRWVNARLSSHPAAIVGNAGANQQVHEALGYHPRRWCVIPNGFETERFRPDPDRGMEIRRRLGLETALEAARRIVQNRSDVSILMIGRGVGWEAAPFRGHQGNRALADRLWLLGERDDIPDLLTAADIGFLSSAYGEGFPNVAGEAMAAGVPMVVTDVGDAANVVGTTGKTVSRRDPHALAEAVLALLSESKTLTHQRREAARSRILQNFTLEIVARRYADFWQEVLDDPGPQSAPERCIRRL